MFTVADLSDIAIQIENNGKESYRQASRAVTDPKVAKMLAWMADEEERHANWFARLPVTSRALSTEEQEIEDMGRALLRDILKSGSEFLHNQTALTASVDIKEVLANARKFEEETIVFYEFLLGLLEDQEAIARLKEIIAEERRHVAILEELHNAPEIAGRALTNC
ncbi:MAG: ferritin family protein [Desulforhopalus sp.]|nr:ferritin family protein [Desulforhopalus sp.]